MVLTVYNQFMQANIVGEIGEVICGTAPAVKERRTLFKSLGKNQISWIGCAVSNRQN